MMKRLFTLSILLLVTCFCSACVKNKYTPSIESPKVAEGRLKMAVSLAISDEDYANALENLGAFYEETGRYDDALANYKECLNIRQRRLGKRHFKTLESLCQLADMQNKKGNFREAEQIYKQVLEHQHAAFGVKSIKVAETLHRLGWLYGGWGKQKLAVNSYEESLAIKKELLDGDNTSIAVTLNNLAIILSGFGQLNEAEAMHKEALRIRKKILDKVILELLIALLISPMFMK